MKSKDRRICVTQASVILAVLSLFGVGILSVNRLFEATHAQGSVAVNARQAAEFIDSVGVNVHLNSNSNSTAYGSFDQIIKPRLIELGITQLRDEIMPNDQILDTRMNQLGALGFKFQLISSPQQVSRPDLLKFIKKYGFIRAVEGPKTPDSTLGVNWLTVTRTYQQDIYQGIKSDPATKNILVAMPLLASANAVTQLGDISSWVDCINLNNYYMGRNPGTAGWGDAGYGSLTWHLGLANQVASGKSVISSESGWHNLVNASGTHPGVPESVAGKYVPRLYLEHLRRGLMRTFAYELIDERNDSVNAANNFGLLRYNGTPKASFVALKNLVSLLRDPGSSFTPGRLGYTLSGNLTDVRQVLLQKRDGTFYLAVWVEAVNWDVDKKIEFTTSPRTLTVAVNSALLSAAYCIPNDGVTWQSLAIRSNSISFPVSDKVTLLKLR